MTPNLQTAPLTTRNATLAGLGAILSQQQHHKFDLVASATAIRAEGGHLAFSDTEPLLTEQGVTSTAGLYLPTQVCDQGLADKLGIPAPYLRKLRTQAIDLYDANVNGWLARATGKRYLVRCLAVDGGPGIARAFLSDGYKIIDDLDVLVAVLDGIRQSRMQVTFDCDLTERRMIVRVRSEQIRSLAPTLLRHYRSPFTGQSGADNPTVFAGFVITNSEVGAGAFSLTPRIVVQVCNNGATFTKDAFRAVHLGARLDEGIVTWSDETRQANLALVTSQARDAVTSFLNVSYVERKIRELEEHAGRAIADPENTIKIVSQRLRFTEAQQRGIFAHFIQGADLTAGGVMHAVTSTAQTLADADIAHEMEAQGLRALEIAASL